MMPAVCRLWKYGSIKQLVKKRLNNAGFPLLSVKRLQSTDRANTACGLHAKGKAHQMHCRNSLLILWLQMNCVKANNEAISDATDI